MKELTIALKKRFLKDRNISLNVLEEPYFTERVSLCDEKDNLDRYKEMIHKDFNDNEQGYLEYYNYVKDKAIDFIKESEAFQALNRDTEINKVKPIIDNLPKTNVYKEPNVGKYFYSIDMQKANFTALVHYGKTHNKAFYPEYDYKGFISQFTDNEHIMESKYIRQVIFGNCNPKRVINYETELMTKLLNKLIENMDIEKSDVYAMQSDEIILRGDRLDLKPLVDAIPNYIDFPVKIESFILYKVVNSDAYIKRIFDDAQKSILEPKCVNPDEMPFIYRLLKKEKYTENDLVFFHNGRLAKFIEYPKLDIVNNMEDLRYDYEEEDEFERE